MYIKSTIGEHLASAYNRAETHLPCKKTSPMETILLHPGPLLYLLYKGASAEARARFLESMKCHLINELEVEHNDFSVDEAKWLAEINTCTLTVRVPSEEVLCALGGSNATCLKLLSPSARVRHLPLMPALRVLELHASALPPFGKFDWLGQFPLLKCLRIRGTTIRRSKLACLMVTDYRRAPTLRHVCKGKVSILDTQVLRTLHEFEKRATLPPELLMLIRSFIQIIDFSQLK